MNDKAVDLILNLNGGGRDDDYIIKTLMNSPQFFMSQQDAVSLVAETLKKKEDELVRSLDLGQMAAVPSPLESLDGSTSSPGEQLPNIEGSIATDSDNAAEGWVADFWGWVGKDDEGMGAWAENMARSFKAGRLEAKTGTETLGALVNPEDGEYDFIAQRLRDVKQLGMSESASKMQEALKDEDLSLYDQLAIMARHPTAATEIIFRSIGQYAAGVTERSTLGAAGAFGVATGTAYGGATAAVSAGVGSIAGPGGTAAGGGLGFGAGFSVGFGKGVIGGVSGAIDAQATVLEILKEELETRGLEATGENVETMFNDSEISDRMASEALARGVTMAVLESIFSFGAGKAMNLAAKSGNKVVRSSAGKRLVGMAVETPGAMLTEGAAQLAATGEIDPFEMVLEGLAELPMSAISAGVQSTASYKINGQKVGVDQVYAWLESGNDPNAVEVKRDSQLQEAVNAERKAQSKSRQEVESMVISQAKKGGRNLTVEAVTKAVNFSYRAVVEAVRDNDRDRAFQIIEKALGDVTVRRMGVLDLNIDEESSGDRALIMSESNFSQEGQEISTLERRAAKFKKDARKASSKAERDRLDKLADSAAREASNRRKDLLERYRKLVLSNPKKAKAIQALDAELLAIQQKLNQPDLEVDTKEQLQAELRRKLEQRVAMDKDFNPDEVQVSDVQKTTGVKEKASEVLQALFDREKNLKTDIAALQDEIATGLGNPEELAALEADLRALQDEKSSVGEAVKAYQEARAEYDSLLDDVGAENSLESSPEIASAEAKVKEAAEALSSVLGIETAEADVATDADTAKGTWSAETQAENHYTDPSPEGELGSTYTLDGVDQVGKPKGSVSIFPERSKIVKGKMTKEEMVAALKEFVQANKDLFDGNEDILSVGTYYDPKSGQTFIDISVVVDKKSAEVLGKQYNQVSVFALDTFEYIPTGGDGKPIDNLKPEVDRVADARKLMGESEPKAETDTETNPDADLDSLVEETRGETKDSKDPTDASGDLPNGVLSTPRTKTGRSNWREGDNGLTAQEAGVLNRFQKLLDVLNIRVAVYGSAEQAAQISGDGTWGGYFTGKPRTIHINPAQIRANQETEFELGYKKTKSFKETVQEEVMHAVIGGTLNAMYLRSPVAAKNFKDSLINIASRRDGQRKRLRERVSAKERQYADSNKPPEVVFEEAVIEILSSFASGDVDMNLIGKVRLAINKLMLSFHGAQGKEFFITSDESMRSIIAKFNMAQEKGLTFSESMDTDTDLSLSGKGRASQRLSPAKLAKGDDGMVTVKFEKPIYKYYGFGEKPKDIGGTIVTKKFRDQWHFINWWKKATDMGRSDELRLFTTEDGTPIDVDRIKSYRSARASNRLTVGQSVESVGIDINRMVAAAEAQGLISGAVASAVRRKTAPLLRKVAQSRRRGQETPKAFDKYPQLEERLKGLQTHVEGIIQREAKAKGLEFNYRGDESDRAADRLTRLASRHRTNPLTKADIDQTGRDLALLGKKRPDGRAVTYETLRRWAAETFDNPQDVEDFFIGSIQDYLVDPELMSEKFGSDNPLDFFKNAHAEAEKVVVDLTNSGKLSGTPVDNLAKLNYFTAILSAKNNTIPNMAAAVDLLLLSESLIGEDPNGIGESLVKGMKGVKGANGVGVRGYRNGLRKLNALISGNLDGIKGISATSREILSDFVDSYGSFTNPDGTVRWDLLTQFLLEPYEGDRLKVGGRTNAQAIFGPKVGAWILNMNQELFPDMENKMGQKLGNIVTVDSHVLNNALLALSDYDGAEVRMISKFYNLVDKIEAAGSPLTEGPRGRSFKHRALNDIRIAQSIVFRYDSLDDPNLDDTTRGEIKRGLLAFQELVKKAEDTVSFLRAEGRESEAESLIEVLEDIESPKISEFAHRKRNAESLVRRMTSLFNEQFPGMNLSESQVGQLIFADRQIFVGATESAIFDADGNLKPSTDYKTYAQYLRSIPPMAPSSDARASEMLLFPTEAGKQDAMDSPLYRNRTMAQGLAIFKNRNSLTDKVVDEALSTDATSRRIIAKNAEVKEGDRVGIRLNLNVMKNTGVPVQTVHNKTATGEALKYSGAVMIKNPVLNVNQNARKKIVTFQENKFPMASVDGEFLTDVTEDMNFNGVKAFFNPFKQNVFVDASGRPIKSASEATVIGNTVYLRGDIEYYDFADPILDKGRKETSEERAKRVKRGPKYDKALNRFKLFSERNGVTFESRLELEYAYDNMPIESKVALDNSEVVSNMEEAQKRASALLKTRRTAGRMAKKYPSLRESILGNPKNYFTPQTLKDLKGEISGKSDQDLISMMSGQGLASLQSRNDDMGVLATAELISRAVARGDMDAVPFLVEQAAAMGTTAGRLLRHLRELKSSTPAGLVAIIESAVGKRGNKLSGEQKSRLESIAGNLYRLQAEHADLVRRAIAGEDVDADLKAKTDEVKAMERQLDTFTNGVIERGWGEIGTMLIQGNLLTPMSQITNVGANMVNAIGKVAVDAIALPIEKLINAFGIESSMKRNYSINAYMYGLRKFGQGFVEALDTIATGQEADVTEWRMHRGFAPFRSILSAMGKGDLPLGPDGTVSLSQRVKLAVQGTLGVPAETMFRFLTLGDTPFRRYVEGIELYHAGRNMGLEGDALAQFMKHPTRRARLEAEVEGRRLTFQEKTGLSEMAEDAVAFMERMIGRGMAWVPGLDEKAFAKFIVRSNMPYVRTPANMLMETLKYVSPYVAGPAIMQNLVKGAAREAAQDFGKIIVGTVVSQTAVALIREGLISEALDWTDDEKRNISYDQFPPSSINVTGVQRWLKGEDPSHQVDDVFVGYNKLGILGAVIGATAKSVDRAELRQRQDEDMATHALQDVFGLGAFSGITYMMDQSFMQGMSTLIEVIAASDADDLGEGFEKWVKTTFQAVSATALPNTLSALHRGSRDYLPDTRVTKDMSRGERILTQMAYTLKDRTFNLSDLPVRVNWKGQPISQTPRGTNGIAYQLFDITKSRQGEADAVSNEIYRLYEQTEDLTKACGTPGYASKRKINVPNIKAKQLQTLRSMGLRYDWMNDSEFMDEAFYLNTTQLNRLMEASGKERYQELETLINSEAYNRLDDEARVEAMNDVNDGYNSAVEMRGRTFRNHTLVLFQIMQEVYENERAED